jgi:hypothetical protein
MAAIKRGQAPIRMPAGYFVSAGRSLDQALARVNPGLAASANREPRGLTVLLTLSPGDG